MMVNVNGACLMIKSFSFLDVSIGFLKINEAFKLNTFILFNGSILYENSIYSNAFILLLFVGVSLINSLNSHCVCAAQPGPTEQA